MAFRNVCEAEEDSQAWPFSSAKALPNQNIQQSGGQWKLLQVSAGSLAIVYINDDFNLKPSLAIFGRLVMHSLAF